MAIDAIHGYLEILQEDGLPIPPSEAHENTAIREAVTVTLKTA
jgi:predicted RNase H-like HicB family nuclease